MNKNIIIAVLFIIIATILYFSFKNKPDTQPFIKKIDSLNVAIENKKEIIKDLSAKAETFDKSQEEYMRIADSLSNYIKTHDLDCPDVVYVQDKEIIALRTALDKCSRAKAIYVQTIGICTDINNDFEQIVFNKDKIINATKKQKRRSLLKGIGIGVGIGATAILIASFL